MTDRTDTSSRSPSASPADSRKATTWFTPTLAVLIALTEVAIGVLVNRLSGSINAILVSFAVVVAVLLVAVYIHAGGDLTARSAHWLRRVGGARQPLILAICTWVAMAGILHGFSDRIDSAPPVPAECPVAPGGPGVVQPTSADTAGLYFCPVRINKGKLPFDGPFRMEGKVLGPLEQRRRILLAVLPNPDTCDARGKRPKGGTFILDQPSLASPDGAWSTFDSFGGYPEGVTLGRTYVYLTASDQTLISLRTDHALWTEAHGPSGYPGIKPLPDDVTTLASFEVPPGIYRGTTVACKPS